MSSSVQYERVGTGEAADGPAAAQGQPPPDRAPQSANEATDGPVGPNQPRRGCSPTALWQQLMFSWVAPLLMHGAKHKLSASNYPALPPRLRVQSAHGRLDAAWRKEVARGRPSGPNLWKVMIRLYWWPFLVMGLAQALTTSTTYSNTYFFQHFIAEIEREDTDVSAGMTWVLLLFANKIVSTIASNQLYAYADVTMLQVRNALRMAVYQKLLKTGTGISKGGVVTIMSTDIGRITHLAWTFHTLWNAPACVILSIAMAASILGVAVVPAVVLAVLLAPLNWLATSKFEKISDGLMKWSSKRMQRVTEAVQGISVIKMFSWERAFASRIGRTRSRELTFVRSFSVSIAALMTIGWVSSSVLALAAFISYTMMGLPLTASVVFPVLYLFDSIVWPMLNLPEVLGSVASARTSVRRMTDFLTRPEVSVIPSQSDAHGSAVWLDDCSLVHEPVVPIMDDSDDEVGDGDEGSDQGKTKGATDDGEDGVDGVAFQGVVTGAGGAGAGAGSGASAASGGDLLDSDYESDGGDLDGIPLLPRTAVTAVESKTAPDGVTAGKPGGGKVASGGKAPVEALHGVTLRVSPGQLVAVVGPVGSGKSSLLGGLLGEVKVSGGKLGVHGKVAYVPQQAWIRSATVRANILCGMDFDAEWYARVVDACALLPDFKQLPAADFTEIGERGITLSGGQKQRISLARAVYRNADVYLLDDPLSAVDAHVGHWLFERCIGPQGVLRGKTRVLVSHQLQVLPDVDVVVMMDRGRVTHTGSYSHLVASGVRFESLAPMQASDGDDAETEAKVSMEDDGPPPELAQLTYAQVVADTGLSEAELVVKGKQVDEEDREHGTVSWRVVRNYVSGLGTWRTFAGLAAITALLHVFGPLTDVWLAMWTSDARKAADGVSDSNVYYMIGLVLITVVYASATFSRNFVWFGATYTASKTIHERMLWSVLRAPMSFFHKTPQGRILNRFSRDQEVVDTELPDNLNDALLSSASLVTTILVVAAGTPPFVALIPLIGIAVYRWCAVYRVNTREMSRIDSITNSPLHSMFSETVDGLATVRALKLQASDIAEMTRRVNLKARARYYWDFGGRWFGARLGMVSAWIVIGVGTAAVVGANTSEQSGSWFSGSAGLVALAVANAMGISGHFSWMVNSFIATEGKMSKVERMMAFIDIQSEAPLEGGPSVTNAATGADVVAPPLSWPTAGCVSFDDVVMQYKAGGERVLNGVSFKTRFFERVGIVGRTGAGKSSLMQALFRMCELTEGTISIDDVDISTLGLGQLRTSISIIPQDPVLFSGTIRSNLAPETELGAGAQAGAAPSDADVWAALERVGMKEHVQQLPLKLNAVVAENGSNLSVGQRQLLCLARALLRKAKVLVMDEATASVDSVSDALIQRTVREAFRGCTVLTIAHRLPTIIDYDRILVMSTGKVAEFGTPYELLQRPDGVFANMVDGTGPVAARWLRQAAARTHAALTARSRDRNRGGSPPPIGVASNAPLPPALRRMNSAPSPPHVSPLPSGFRTSSYGVSNDVAAPPAMSKLRRLQSQ